MQENDKEIAILTVSQTGVLVAEKIIATWQIIDTCHVQEKHEQVNLTLHIAKEHNSTEKFNVVRYENFATHIKELYQRKVPLICIAATGIVIRCLAIFLGKKSLASPVIVVDAGGRYVIPLLGAHQGGIILARQIADNIKAKPVITTSSDEILGFSFDEPPKGYVFDKKPDSHKFIGKILSGERFQCDKELYWMNDNLPINCSGLESDKQKPVLHFTLDNSRKSHSDDNRLVYRRKDLCIGIGTVRGACIADFITAIDKALVDLDCSPDCIAGLFSIDIKINDAVIAGLCDYYNCRSGFFPASILRLESENLTVKSELVYRTVGCYGVAEAAALTAAGKFAKIIKPKQIIGKIGTFAIVSADRAIDFAGIKDMITKGVLTIIGIGAGAVCWRSIECEQELAKQSDLVGYKLYLDLIKDQHADKSLHSFNIGEERKRVRHAIELAAKGKKVGLISSGDAGIYGLASLVFDELANGRQLPSMAKHIEIKSVSGITAMQSAASFAGAPLGNDFCAISLSNLMTPDEIIKKRLKMALEADFVIALYNPVSKRRKKLFDYAIKQIDKYRGLDCPIVIARELGRKKQKTMFCKLGDIINGIKNNDQLYQFDMVTLIIVGNSQSQFYRHGDGRDFIWTSRGYKI